MSIIDKIVYVKASLMTSFYFVQNPCIIKLYNK